MKEAKKTRKITKETDILLRQFIKLTANYLSLDLIIYSTGTLPYIFIYSTSLKKQYLCHNGERGTKQWRIRACGGRCS